MSNEIKHVADWSAVGVAMGAFFKILPEITALLSFIWISLRIYDWIEDRVKRRRSK